ncbi:MAG: RHS repeat-associated core domain-containing protein [bacterium]
MRARYYDPATGRLLTQDPLGLQPMYGYVANNPPTRPRRTPQASIRPLGRRSSTASEVARRARPRSPCSKGRWSRRRRYFLFDR